MVSLTHCGNPHGFRHLPADCPLPGEYVRQCDEKRPGRGKNYDPLVAILHSTTGEVLYSNKPDVHIPLKPDGIERFTEDGETRYLAYNTDPDMQRTAVIGESGTDRHMLIGDPAAGTAVPLLFILGTMLSSTIITTYLQSAPAA